jgi:hypothetical protein
MGDHRADVKIEFTFHGKTEKFDAWINWCPDSDGDYVIDPRVVNFFRRCYNEGMDRYNDAVYESQRKEREIAERAQELCDLRRLKEKYPDAP